MTFIPTRDFLVEVAKGNIAGHSLKTIVGTNNSIGTGVEDIWTSGSTYSGFLTTAATAQIIAGGNANDTSAGTGARQITVEGLDASFDEATETITTAGASASSATTTSWIRVHKLYVSQMGTYTHTAANAGLIDVRAATGSPFKLGEIVAGDGESKNSMYTIPNGKTGYLIRTRIAIEAANTAEVRLWQFRDADDSSVPVSSRRLLYEAQDIEGWVEINLGNRQMPAKTDIWWDARRITGSGGTQVTVATEILLVDD